MTAATIGAVTLPTFFTLDEAVKLTGWSHGARSLAFQMRQLGYSPRRLAWNGAVRSVWSKPEGELAPDGTAGAPCVCRCHTGTCGANGMDLAERTIRLVERLRPTSAEAIDALVDLVASAGVDHARAAMGFGDLDDDVPF